MLNKITPYNICIKYCTNPLQKKVKHMLTLSDEKKEKNTLLTHPYQPFIICIHIEFLILIKAKKQRLLR